MPGVDMTTVHDIPADLMIEALSSRLAEDKTIEAPEWSRFVKTGIHRERAPIQENWWSIRSAAVLRTVGKRRSNRAKNYSRRQREPG